MNWRQSNNISLKKIRSFVFLLFLLFIVDNALIAQYSVNRKPQDEHLIVSTMDLIYNFQFEEAQKQITEVKKRFPNHPIYHFLAAMACYWEMVPIAIENPRYKTYEYHLLKTLELSEAMLQNESTTQEATYYMMAANSSLIVSYLKAKDYGKSIAEARKTYAFMKEGFDWGEKYPDFNFSSGLYYFYAEQYPETHPIIQPLMWFFTKGDREKGIALLKKSAQNSVFSKTESDYFLAHVYLKYYNQPNESLKYAKKLIEKYPNNYFYISRYTEALVLLKKYVEAKPFAEKLLKNQIDYAQISGNLFLAMIELANNSNAAAKRRFEVAEKLSLTSKKQTADYLAFVYLGLGKIYEKENNPKKAEKYFDKLQEIGEYKIHNVELEAYKKRKKAAKGK
ncbi:MAG: hypothetical protein ACKVOU_08950 [Cytophagales bacterium]